jgi:hypothetical protein
MGNQQSNAGAALRDVGAGISADRSDVRNQFSHRLMSAEKPAQNALIINELLPTLPPAERATIVREIYRESGRAE